MLVPAPNPKLARGTAPDERNVMRGSPPLSAPPGLVVSTNPGSGLPKGSVKRLAGLILTSWGAKSVTLRVYPTRPTLSQLPWENVSSITADCEPGRLVMEPLNGFC